MAVAASAAERRALDGIQPESKKSERSPASAESVVTIWIDRLNVP